MNSRPSTLVFMALIILFAMSRAPAATVSVSAGNATKCRVNYGSGFGSQTSYTNCRGPAAFGYGVLYNDTTRTISNAGSSATLEIDAGVLTDTAARPARLTLEQNLQWNITLEVQAAPGESWTLRMDQSVTGFFALLEETPGDGNGALEARYDVNQDINVWLGGIVYNVDIDPYRIGGTGTRSAEFSGARSDQLSGIGSTTLTGFMRTDLVAYSACLSVNPTCSNGPEAAVLFGLDDVGGALAVTADDYATWGRSAASDGYNLTFTLIPVPAAAWLFASGLGLLAAMRKRKLKSSPPA